MKLVEFKKKIAILFGQNVLSLFETSELGGSFSVYKFNEIISIEDCYNLKNAFLRNDFLEFEEAIKTSNQESLLNFTRNLKEKKEELHFEIDIFISGLDNFAEYLFENHGDDFISVLLGEASLKEPEEIKFRKKFKNYI